jgi:hypothetical protein
MRAEVIQQPPGTLIELAAGLRACEKRLHVLAAVKGDRSHSKQRADVLNL